MENLWFWLVLFLLALAVSALALWPIWMKKPVSAPGMAEQDKALYRRQFKEIEDEHRRGLLSDEDFEALRREVGRRLLAADIELTRLQSQSSESVQTKEVGGTWIVKLITLGGVLTFSFASMGVYAFLGSPQFEDKPLAQRPEYIVQMQQLRVIGMIEKHLVDNPQDERGWLALGAAYWDMNHLDEARRAYEKGLQITGARADILNNLGVLEFTIADGTITPKARAYFDQALALDPMLPEARYYLGLLALQEGRMVAAREVWLKLLEDFPEEADWQASVRRDINILSKAINDGIANSGASPSERNPVAGQSEKQSTDVAVPDQADPLTQMDEQQQAMINTMVSTLDQRLKSQGGTLEEWMRLVRSYQVLGRIDDVKATIERARQAFVAQPEALSTFEQFLKDNRIAP